MMPATHTSGTLAARQLPAKPNLEHLKNEAKQRLESLRASSPTAKLAEVQHQLAREYGFPNWRELKAAVESHSGVQLSRLAQIALGHWIGDFAGDSRIAMHVRRDEEDGLALTLDSVDLGFFGMVADDVVLENERLSFALIVPLVTGSQQVFYEARWDTDRQRWIGEWTGHGVTVSVDFVRGEYPAAPRIEGLDGFWDARVETKDGLIRLIVRFRTDRHGTYAWMDSPDRNLLGRPAVSISREGRKVTVAMKTVRVEGELSEDGQRIEGRLHKGESATPLTFHHRAPGAAAPLPQRAPVIELTPQALAAFAGRYEFETGLVMTVTAGDGRLWLQALGGEVTGSDGERRVQLASQLRQDLLPIAPARFIFRQFDATAEFELDADGKVAGLVQRQTGRETRARRLG
jgi:hypothetical protein